MNVLDEMISCIANIQNQLPFTLELDQCGNQYTPHALQNKVHKCGTLHTLQFNGGGHIANDEYITILTDAENKLETIIFLMNDTLTTETITQITEVNTVYLKSIQTYGCDNVNTEKLLEVYGNKYQIA